MNNENLLDLKGSVALVTGAGQGVGRQVAHHLAAHGAGGIAVNDYFPERAQAVADELAGNGYRATAVPFDVTDRPAIAEMVRVAESELGPIDILVNNAGNAGPVTPVAEPEPFWESDPASWKNWIDVNLYGVLYCTHHVVGGMVSRERGRVITITSDAGRVGEPWLVVYSAAKAGGAGFTRALAKAVGRFGITANCISLGTMRTPATESLLEDENAVRKILRSYVIRRLGEPEDAANLVLFLASDAASWITGQTIPVNGGYSFAV